MFAVAENMNITMEASCPTRQQTTSSPRVKKSPRVPKKHKLILMADVPGYQETVDAIYEAREQKLREKAKLKEELEQAVAIFEATQQKKTDIAKQEEQIAALKEAAKQKKQQNAEAEVAGKFKESAYPIAIRITKENVQYHVDNYLSHLPPNKRTRSVANAIKEAGLPLVDFNTVDFSRPSTRKRDLIKSPRATVGMPEAVFYATPWNVPEQPRCPLPAQERAYKAENAKRCRDLTATDGDRASKRVRLNEYGTSHDNGYKAASSSPVSGTQYSSDEYSCVRNDPYSPPSSASETREIRSDFEHARLSDVGGPHNPIVIPSSPPPFSSSHTGSNVNLDAWFHHRAWELIRNDGPGQFCWADRCALMYFVMVTVKEGKVNEREAENFSRMVEWGWERLLTFKGAGGSSNEEE